MTREERIAEIRERLADYDRGLSKPGACPAALMDFWSGAGEDVRLLLAELDRAGAIAVTRKSPPGLCSYCGLVANSAGCQATHGVPRSRRRPTTTHARALLDSTSNHRGK